MLRHAVERLVARNDRVWSSDDGALAGEEKGMAAFRGVRVPRMGVGEYVERIGRYAGAAMSPSCFVVAFVLLDRAAHRRPAHPLELLFLLDFELTVTPRVYESYYFHLHKEMLASGTYKQRITRSPTTGRATTSTCTRRCSRPEPTSRGSQDLRRQGMVPSTRTVISKPTSRRSQDLQ
ncbi:Cyclin-P1-1 [Ananas comosus]|uniref:Cyclin-P1-1 n=1 Tax=Ananas comosus TaxID=4615 RepID=A0A199VRD1_ANACO|nr:Cyclin-P1-1 [Ananas comosus]